MDHANRALTIRWIEAKTTLFALIAILVAWVSSDVFPKTLKCVFGPSERQYMDVLAGQRCMDALPRARWIA